MSWLYSNGAAGDITRHSNSKKSPFAIACEKQHMDMIRFFIEHADQANLSTVDIGKALGSFNRKNKSTLYQQAVHNRDVEHEMYLMLVAIGQLYKPVKTFRGLHNIGKDCIGVIGDFVRGSANTRKLWKFIYDGGSASKK